MDWSSSTKNAATSPLALTAAPGWSTGASASRLYNAETVVVYLVGISGFAAKRPLPRETGLGGFVGRGASDPHLLDLGAAVSVSGAESCDRNCLHENFGKAYSAICRDAHRRVEPLHASSSANYTISKTREAKESELNPPAPSLMCPSPPIFATAVRTAPTWGNGTSTLVVRR